MSESKTKSQHPNPISRDKKRPSLFLVDGNSFCYRAYYAIQSLSNSKGEPTNAIYGFITMIRKLFAETSPDYVAVCFDRPEPTFRHDRFSDYKKHRKPMPEDLVQQIEPIKEFCRISNWAIFEKAGFEADDVIGTLAMSGEKNGMDVFIITGDKDALQLVTDHVKVLNPHKENLIYDESKVKERFEGLCPEQVVDLMSLMGDSSDNIPGVPGIGEKTALKLMHQFGSVDKLIENVDRVSSKSQRTLLKDNLELLRLSRELARIDTAVPLEVDWENLHLRGPEVDRLQEFCKRYEFRALFKEMAPSGETQERRDYKTVAAKAELEALIHELNKAKAFSIDTETTSEDPVRAKLVGLSFSFKPLSAYYVPVSSEHHKGPGLPESEVLEKLRPLLEGENVNKYGQNIKYDWMVLKRAGIDLRGIVFDTMIASYLVNPLKLNHNLDDITLEYLGVKKITTQSLLGSGKSQIRMDEVALEKISSYAAEDADCVFRLVPVLQEKLREHDLLKLFSETELPLADVLAKIELNGVYVDLDVLKKMSEDAGRELERLTSEIYEQAGEEFNINSPKQLSELLFTKMKLPSQKKTKTGFSTDVSVLEKLALNYELPRKILEYREKTKLKSTYLDALPEMVNPETHLIHTSYHQTTTATGRLSSSDPNLQNIPIKTEAGRLIRKAFVARPAKHGPRKILSADYSQIELRILAHLTDDPNLVSAFREDRDIHKFTATLLYGVKEAEVTRQMRNVAKTINFSVIYGKTAYGLSQDLGISISEADGFIENYFKRYQGVREYLDAQKELARKQGYLVTILGRRSYFPDIHSKNVQMRQFAERAAINAPIQGSAADLIKLAMITIQNELETRKLHSLMIMQVHDELVFDMPESETETLEALVKKGMEGVYKMKVPLRADLVTGDSWYKN